MAKNNPYVAVVSTLRPDRDDHLLEGSACTVRIEVGVEGDSDCESVPLGLGVDDDNSNGVRMVVAVPEFLPEFLGLLYNRGFCFRFEVVDSPHEWLWPKMARQLPELTQAITFVTEESVNGPVDQATITISAIPGDRENEAIDLVNRYRSGGGTRTLWRRILHSGVITLRMMGDVCSISMDCADIDQTIHDVRVALDAAGVPALWES
jgi:hypothetical protein